MEDRIARLRHDRERFLALRLDEQQVVLGYLQHDLSRIAGRYCNNASSAALDRRGALAVLSTRISKHQEGLIKNRKSHTPASVIKDLYEYAVEYGLEDAVAGLMSVHMSLSEQCRDEK